MDRKLDSLDKTLIHFSKSRCGNLDRNLYTLDLTLVMEKACAINPGWMNPYEAYKALCTTFNKVATPQMHFGFQKRLFKDYGNLTPHPANFHDAVYVMLMELSVMQVYDTEKEEPVWDIGERDLELMKVGENTYIGNHFQLSSLKPGLF